MIWTVIYRDDASGRQGKLELEAANRGDVFLQMQKKKLRVLNLVEGALAEDKPKKGKKKKEGTPGLGGRLLFWLVFLLAAAGIAFWMLRDSPLLKEVPFLEEVLGRESEPEPEGSVEIRSPQPDPPDDGRAPGPSRIKIRPASADPLRPHGEK